MDSTVSELKPGAILDSRYHIKSQIAKGGMATVYLALDDVLNIDIALKVMFPHLLDDKKFVHRFNQEARNAAVLNNPHVVKTLNQGRSGPFMYLVMEYLDGYTLRDILYQEDYFTPRQTLEALEPILSGVAAAHRAKIIHRDLKPENVLITEDGRIKIADFGLARMMDNNTVTGSLLGTVAYMAPELATHGDATESSDVYSLGVMAFEMLTGQQPFQGDTPLQVVYSHVNDTVPAPSTLAPGLAEELDEFVEYCTQSNPLDRPKDAAIMLAEVQRLLRVLPDAVLDYNFSQTPEDSQDATVEMNNSTKKVDFTDIKLRPHTEMVPQISDEETELIPAFIQEHNRTLAQTRMMQQTQQPSQYYQDNYPAPGYNQPGYTAEGYHDVVENTQTTALGHTAALPYEYREQNTYTPPEPSVVPEKLTKKDQRKHQKHLKKAAIEEEKIIKKGYKVRLRPGNAALRTVLSTSLVSAATLGSAYAGWYFSHR